MTCASEARMTVRCPFNSAFNSSHLNTNFHRFVPTTRAPGMESANNGSVLTWT